METKTLTYLNSKAWYRLLKVIFGLLILVALLIYNGLIISSGVKRLDNKQTLIHCTRNDQKVLTPKQADITLSTYQLKDGFDYKKFFEGYNEYTIRNIFKSCYDTDTNLDIFAIQRVYEIRGNKKNEELSQTDKDYMNSQIKEITTGFKTDSQKAKYLDYSVKLFDIKPVITYTEFIKWLIIGNTIVLLFFEVLRRIFYYIVLGKFRP